MDRQELRRLTHEELIELVLRRQEMVGAVVAQQGLIERLTARAAALEATLSGPPKTPGSSPLPPPGLEANRAERRRAKRGPKRGHQGMSRRRQRPDVVVRCRPERCGGCGEPLPVGGQQRVGRSQMVELPPLHHPFAPSARPPESLSEA